MSSKMDLLSQTMGTSENFCLRWNNFASNISTAFKELRERSDLLDVTLGCTDSEGRTLQAHGLILSACSTFFRNVICQATAQNLHQRVFIYLKGISFNDLSQVLDFMYTRKIFVEKRNLNSLLSVIEELQINVDSVGLTCIEDDDKDKTNSGAVKSNTQNSITPETANIKQEIIHHELQDTTKQEEQLTVDLDEFQNITNGTLHGMLESKNNNATEKEKRRKKAKHTDAVSENNSDETMSKEKSVTSITASSDNMETSNTAGDPGDPNVETIGENSHNAQEGDVSESSKGKTKNALADISQATSTSVVPRKPGPKRPRGVSSSTKNNVSNDKTLSNTSQGDTATRTDDRNSTGKGSYKKNGPIRSNDTKQTSNSDPEIIVETTGDNTNPVTKRKRGSWPPDKGSMIATLYVDGFYVGKVLGDAGKDGSVRVSYMVRRDHSENPNAHEDQYWVWPEKNDIYQTRQESVLGENLKIEMVGKTDDKGQNIYRLHDYENMSKLANDSKKSIKGKRK